MNEQLLIIPTEERTFIRKHSLLLMIIFSILISSVLVWISINIYYKSGAAQLDLSRPGYMGVRSQVETGDSGFQDYSETGPIDSSAINEFKLLFDKQAKKVKAANAFGGDPLSPDALGIDGESK